MPVNAQDSNTGPGGMKFVPGYGYEISPGVWMDAGGKVYTKAMIDASLAQNPQASSGGYEGATPMSGTTTVAPLLDWHSYLADWGFTPEIVTELDRIFRTYSDPAQAGQAALAYIRGTAWYATTFAGIGEGIKKGLISDEAGYRSYVNQVNQYYQRYMGRDVTTAEIADLFSKGWNPTMAGSHFQGQAYIAANRNDFQTVLGAYDENGQATEEQLNALGDQYGGLDNGMGPQIQARLDKARTRMQRIMQGTLASPSLSMMQGHLATSTGSGKTPDVAA